jgi:hypothetical protein
MTNVDAQNDKGDAQDDELDAHDKCECSFIFKWRSLVKLVVVLGVHNPAGVDHLWAR